MFSYFYVLLSDTKVRKHIVEQVGGGNFAQNVAEVGNAFAQVLGHEVGGEAGGEAIHHAVHAGQRLLQCLVVALVAHDDVGGAGGLGEAGKRGRQGAAQRVDVLLVAGAEVEGGTGQGGEVGRGEQVRFVDDHDELLVGHEGLQAGPEFGVVCGGLRGVQ